MSKVTSGTLDGTFKMTLNDQALNIQGTNFASKNMGFDSTIECWIPAKMTGAANVKEGLYTLVIESTRNVEIDLLQIALRTDGEIIGDITTVK